MNKKLENKPGIYKIINIVNNKYYIGSSRNVKQRKYEHFQKLKENKHANKHLQYACNKYGIENFKFEVIEYLIDRNKLIEREQYWIDELEACDINKGYNILPIAGSQLGAKRDDQARKNIKLSQRSFKVIQIDLNGNIVREWFSLKDIFREYGIGSKQVKKYISNKASLVGFYWVYKDDIGNFSLKDYKIKDVRSKIGRKFKSILQISNNTNEIIEEWDSITNASETLHIDSSSICKVLTGKNKTAGGFRWEYKDYEPDFYYVYLGNKKFEKRKRGENNG